MRREDFNRAERGAAVVALRPCVDVARWYDGLVDARPFVSVDALVEAASRMADPFTSEEIDAALAHHPRIGERALGESRESDLSRAEQSGVDPSDADVQDALRAGNRAYEERFGRVFLIRAAGRSAVEILANLRERLQNDADVEELVVAQQLREIALLRLRGTITE